MNLRLSSMHGSDEAVAKRTGLIARPHMNRVSFATVSDDRATDPIFSHLLKAGEIVFHNHEHRRCGNELELLRNYSATEENPWHVQLLMRK
jgi:hypothetical protein